MMIRLLTASALAALSCTAAHAELRDVSLLQSEGRTQLWLAFDSQPQSVEIQPGSGLVLHVDGVSLDRSRHIEPAVRGPVSALALSRAPNGVSISLSGAFAGGEAEVREGGVLVTLSGVTGQSAPIRRSPPRAPVSEQGAACPAPTASTGVRARRVFVFLYAVLSIGAFRTAQRWRRRCCFVRASGSGARSLSRARFGGLGRRHTGANA
jgi:hypothetical protein